MNRRISGTCSGNFSCIEMKKVINFQTIKRGLIATLLWTGVKLIGGRIVCLN